MTDPFQPEAAEAGWGSSYRLVASEKWKAKSATMGGAVTAALVEYAQPEPGMRVLDLASGTGEPAISIAKRVGERGHVTALDLSAELLEIAEGRARAGGLEEFFHAAGRRACAALREWQLRSGNFALRRNVFGDAVGALEELRRVLTEGARACFLAWGPFDQPYWQSTMAVAHRHVGGALLRPDGPDPFRFAEPGSLSQVLRSAGFRDTQEETRTLPWTWPGTPEEVWEQAQAVSMPFKPMLERVPEKMWPQINRDVRTAVGGYVRGENIEFTARVVMASGRK